MSRTYTKREIANLIDCSVSTIEKDVDHLRIRPSKGSRGINLYSQADYDLIKQMREHCSHNRSRDSFAPKAQAEIVMDETDIPKITKLVRYEKLNLVKNNFSQSLEFGLRQDPLYDLEILQRISDNHWLLPASRLAPIFNITPAYLNGKKIHEYCGFVANKEVRSGGVDLWKVSANNS